MRLLSVLLLSTSLIFATCALAEEEDEEEVEEEKKELSYFQLKPSLIANIKGRRTKFARCDIQFMTTDKERLPELELHTPAVRHELLLLLSEQDGKVLKTQEGREKFRQEALEAAQGVMEEQTGENFIEDMFFTSFFIQ